MTQEQIFEMGIEVSYIRLTADFGKPLSRQGRYYRTCSPTAHASPHFWRQESNKCYAETCAGANRKERQEKVPRLYGVLLVVHGVVVDVLLVLGVVDVLLDLVHVDVGNGRVAVEYAGDLLEGGALGLDVEEPDEDELDEVPEGVEQHEVPVVGEVVPGELVGLAMKDKVSTMMGWKRVRLGRTYFPTARTA